MFGFPFSLFVLGSVLMLLTSGAANAQTVTLIDPGNDNRIATITGITIGGVEYDATFHHGISFNNLPAPQFTFGGAGAFDFSNSVPAAEALAAAVASTPNASNPTVSALVPNGTFFGNRVTLAWIPVQPNYSSWAPSDVVPAWTTQGFVLPQNYAWVTFEEAAAVPEPGGLLMSAAMAMAFAMTHRRRREKPATVRPSRNGREGVR